MSEFLLTQVVNYGAPLLGVIVFIGGLGVPRPCTLLVIAAGAFVRQGFLPWHVTALISIISVIMGDSLSYAMGYYAREKALDRFSHTRRWKKAELTFRKWGALSIFFSRFLVTAIALPITLLSGVTRYSFAKWLRYDALGETVWIFGYGGLGYLFGSQWETVNDFLGNFGGLALGVVVLIFGIRQAAPQWAKRKRSGR